MSVETPIVEESKRSGTPADIRGAPLLPILTLVAWTVCLAVGILGLEIPYFWTFTSSDSADATPVTVDLLGHDPTHPRKRPRVTKIVIAPKPARKALAPKAPAKMPDPAALDLPRPHAMTAVAAPDSSISFAIPLHGLTRMVSVDDAGYHVPAAAISRAADSASRTSGPVVQTLTLGNGAGLQPRPDYPRYAVENGEEGRVRLRFHVDRDGDVTSVKVVGPCRWPSLNQAAERAVRDTWSFDPGPLRIYEVTIEFVLN